MLLVVISGLDNTTMKDTKVTYDIRNSYIHILTERVTFR